MCSQYIGTNGCKENAGTMGDGKLGCLKDSIDDLVYALVVRERQKQATIQIFVAPSSLR